LCQFFQMLPGNPLHGFLIQFLEANHLIQLRGQVALFAGGCRIAHLLAIFARCDIIPLEFF
jgi:hypothetical protein